MKSIKKMYEYADKKTGVWAALLSGLTLFSMLVYFIPGCYDTLPSMGELLCGQIIWKGYAKQTDLMLIKCVIVGFPILFALFYSMDCLLRWKKLMDETARRICVGGYFIGAVLVLVQSDMAGQYLAIYGILLMGYLICRLKTDQEKAGTHFMHGFMASFLLMAACVSGVLLLSFRSVKIALLWHQISIVIIAIWAGSFLVLCLLKEKNEKYFHFFYYLQAFLPVGILGMVHFRYRLEADKSLMELFYSGRWKLFCLALTILLCISCIWQLRRKKQTLTWSTFVVTAALRVFMQPDGIMNVDFFHNGELTMPMQQLVSYGRVPYKDLIPIHGMCDYYYGMLTYLFFDGSYLSLNAAKIVGNVLMAAVLATVIYFFVRSHNQGLILIYLFMPYLINQAGMRYLLLFIMFFVLFSYKLRDGFWYIYAWVLLSIFATAWNASIGSAAAAAFLPVVLWRMVRLLPSQIRELPGERKKELLGKVISLPVLLVIGIAYIPMFARIVMYLKDNAGTTLFVNGMEMFPDVSEVAGLLVPAIGGTGGTFFLSAFGFLIPIIVCLLYIEKKGNAYAGEYVAVLLTCYLVLINYAFVRFDEGLRATVMAVFFTLLITVTLLFEEISCHEEMAQDGDEGNKNSSLTAYMICLGVSLCLTNVSPLMTEKSLPLCTDIPASIETTIMGKEVDDPVVYVTGESVGIPGLGNGFIQGNSLNSLQNVATVITKCRQAGMTCYDMTNEIANQVIFDTDNYLPYTSVYNISNDRMQKQAIHMLAEKLPDCLLVSPEIVFDDAPFSLRSPILYQYLMKQGYKTYKFENVIYLLRGENPVEGARQDELALAQLWHKNALGYLPRIWGISEKEQLQDVTMKLPVCRIEETEDGFDVVFDSPIAGSDLTLLALDLAILRDETVQKEEANQKEGTTMTASFHSDLVENAVEAERDTSGDDRAENRYAFTLEKSGTYMLPLGLSPYFTKTKQLDRIAFRYHREDCQIDTAKCQVRAYQFLEE